MVELLYKSWTGQTLDADDLEAADDALLTQALDSPSSASLVSQQESQFSSPGAQSSITSSSPLTSPVDGAAAAAHADAAV